MGNAEGSEVIEPIAPRGLIIPATGSVVAGAIKLSGAKLWFYSGTGWDVVTSA